MVTFEARPASPGVGFGDSPRGALRGLLDRVCAQEGRPEEAGRWTRYLESEWQTVESLRNLSDSDWEKLKLPLGLAQVLRRNLSAKRPADVDDWGPGHRLGSAKRPRFWSGSTWTSETE